MAAATAVATGEVRASVENERVSRRNFHGDNTTADDDGGDDDGQEMHSRQRRLRPPLSTTLDKHLESDVILDVIMHWFFTVLPARRRVDNLSREQVSSANHTTE